MVPELPCGDTMVLLNLVQDMLDATGKLSCLKTETFWCQGPESEYHCCREWQITHCLILMMLWGEIIGYGPLPFCLGLLWLQLPLL
jgi:hypothetical protein